MTFKLHGLHRLITAATLLATAALVALASWALELFPARQAKAVA